MRQWKTEDPAVQLEPEPSQHAFTKNPAIDVDDVFQTTTHQHQGEIEEGQGEQIGNLIDLETQNVLREVHTADRLVDDDLGNLEGDIYQRHG